MPTSDSKWGLELFQGWFTSARRYKLTPQTPVANFLEWAQSPEAARDVDNTRILSVSWMKGKGIPSHEYIVITLEHGSSLRLERNTDSWITAFRPKTRSNCKDTITFVSGYGRRGLDKRIAWATFDINVRPPLRRLIDLLRIISETADFYNMWTLNCWWYASCIWTNIIGSRQVNISGCSYDIVAQWRKVSGEDGKGVQDSPMKVARILQFIHVAGLQRALGDNEGPEMLNRISARISQEFESTYRASLRKWLTGR
ncbi:hypothetical protein JAAARDRAFT_208129 [Jaapia argillacea MUCL 33604]|uniref:Uncharacterized protein n=1 Tax=Jaapia argillacea MUCL 33604 TaxID=933084 RepID=A0A067Q1J9_9AGAM|nr:hypothetical protein JAAARDRAFT_208129 [Jaapia argillacea MUCL 33604]